MECRRGGTVAVPVILALCWGALAATTRRDAVAVAAELHYSGVVWSSISGSMQRGF